MDFLVNKSPIQIWQLLKGSKLAWCFETTEVHFGFDPFWTNRYTVSRTKQSGVPLQTIQSDILVLAQQNWKAITEFQFSFWILAVRL